MNYYELHIGDYAKDAGHLSMLEDGAYRRLLDVYYGREKPLPANVKECCKLARATTAAEKKAVIYVLSEFFEAREDGHYQKRADEEIARYQDKQEKARKSAAARWNKEGTHSEGNADAAANAHADGMRTHSEGNAPRARPQTPDTRHQTPERGARKGARSQSVQFSTWLASLPEGEDAIRPDDPVFQFAADAGIPEDMLALAWAWFERTYTGSRKSKRYTDWRQVFRNAVEGNWPKVWRFTPDGQCLLTSEGEMLRRALEAEARRAAA